MNGIVLLLRILSVPLLVAVLTQGIHLSLSGFEWEATGAESMLTNGDAARVKAINQASWALILTLIIGMPFFRYWARRGELGYAEWMIGWMLVHSLFFISAWLQMNNFNERIAEIFILGGSVLFVASLWWRLFYTGKQEQ